MEADHWHEVQGVFGTVVDLPAGEQAEAIARLCHGDPALASSVLELLEEDTKHHGMLDLEAGELVGQAVEATLSSDHLNSLVQGQIGPYRLLRVLGEGGMGVVYLAERIDIGRLVAIKLLRDAWLSPMRRERFLLEQQTLVKLNHPSIASLYDANTLEDGTPWFVMEYAEGLPLIEALRARGGSLRDDLEIFERVCEAVQYAHSHAVIHRDLKPSNIFCTLAGDVKLLDFGIAKQVDAGLEQTTRTIAGLRLMTPGYAAPEQSSGGSIGTFTDVYSLGALLYELLTGQVPVRGPDQKLAKPSAVARLLPSDRNKWSLSRQKWAELDVLCLTALEVEPEQRYRSADALSNDVRAFLEERPLEARPGSLVSQLVKFARRNRLAISSVAAGVLLLATASLWFTVRLAWARDAAVLEARRTERIQRFMQNMLGDAEVEAGPASDLKVVTLLDRAEQQAGSLGADSETQAQLYLTIGTMFARLGKYGQAEQVLTLALNRARALGNAEEATLAEILVQRGAVRGDHAELKAARQDVEEALRIASGGKGAANEATLVKARVALGRIELQSGEYAKAIDILSPIADGQAGSGIATPYDRRDSFSALGEAELYTHRYNLSEEYTRQAIDLDRELLGDSHPQTGEDLVNLGSLEASRGAFADAERFDRQGLGVLSAWYGPDHPDVVTATSLLARVLLSQKKTDEAEPLLERVLESQEKTFGLVHERVAFDLDALAELAIYRGQLQVAEAELVRSAGIDRSLLGEDNVHTASEESNLGRVYLREHKYALAEATLSHAARTLQSLPDGSNYTGLTLGRWGEALLALKRYKEAKSQLLVANQLMSGMSHPPAELREVNSALVSLSQR